MSLALLRGHRPPSESQLVDSVEGIMGRHGLETASFFGHSFGSISVAWMARRKPHVSYRLLFTFVVVGGGGRVLRSFF